MQIQQLEIKKMVYLFLINYGRARPQDTAHAIQSFLVVRDVPPSPRLSRFQSFPQSQLWKNARLLALVPTGVGAVD